MYYPYLRGKQFELLALREFAPLSKSGEYIFPVIEPVKRTLNGLNKAIEVLNNRSVHVGIIQNPQVGDLVGLETLIEQGVKYLPNCTKTYIVRDNVTYVERQLNQSEKKCILIITADTTEEEDDILRLGLHSKVSLIIADEKHRNIKRKLRTRNPNIRIALLSDNFISRQRNADYLNHEDEAFSEDYFFYSEENYFGVSDYSVLSSQYTEGGRLPYAVAIHLTYCKGEQVRLRHFISDSNYDTADIQGKFKEAAMKAVTFCEKQGLDTEGVRLLKFYVEKGIYPGLGMLKKISILHHLEIVKSIMEDKHIF